MKKIGLLLFLGLVVALVGCKSSAGLPPKTIETTREVVTEIVVRDTVFTVEKDYSYYQAYIDCIDGVAVLKNQTAKAGTRLDAPKVTIKNNKLQVDCHQRALELFHQWKEQHTTEREVVVEQIPYAVEKPFTNWQIVQLYLGRLFLFLLLAFAIAVGLRAKKII